MKIIISCLIALVFISLAFIPTRASQSIHNAGNILNALEPNELINEVNALRASEGLSAYNIDPILMQISQNQAEYMASISVVTHYDPNGYRPFQRALAAGYLVAGDLSLGGWFSENITGGVGLTPKEAVEDWTGDKEHQNTMLSETLQDVGAGIAAVGTTYYYVLDAGLSTGGTPVAYILPGPSATATVMISSPNPDGSIIHIVKPGESISVIADAYDISQNDILRFNNLTSESVIFTGQKLVIRLSPTLTPTLPTSTSTRRPTATNWPTSTATSIYISTEPATLSPGIPLSAAIGAVIIIIVVALLIAGASSFLGTNKYK